MKVFRWRASNSVIRLFDWQDLDLNPDYVEIRYNRASLGDSLFATKALEPFESELAQFLRALFAFCYGFKVWS